MADRAVACADGCASCELGGNGGRRGRFMSDLADFARAACSRRRRLASAAADSTVRKCGLLSEKSRRPFFIRTPHALHSVLGPSGLRRQSGVDVLAQLRHVRGGSWGGMVGTGADKDWIDGWMDGRRVRQGAKAKRGGMNRSWCRARVTDSYRVQTGADDDVAT